MATPYEVTLTPSAYEHIKALRRYDRNAVLDAIKRQLVNAPSEETRNRKLLRKNPFADWELRVGRCRVLYDVDEEQRDRANTCSRHERRKQTDNRWEGGDTVKTVNIASQPVSAAELLDMARGDSLLVKTEKGDSFVISQADEFVTEVELLRATMPSCQCSTSLRKKTRRFPWTRSRRSFARMTSLGLSPLGHEIIRELLQAVQQNCPGVVFRQQHNGPTEFVFEPLTRAPAA